MNLSSWVNRTRARLRRTHQDKAVWPAHQVDELAHGERPIPTSSRIRGIPITACDIMVSATGPRPCASAITFSDSVSALRGFCFVRFLLSARCVAAATGRGEMTADDESYRGSHACGS